MGRTWTQVKSDLDPKRTIRTVPAFLAKTTTWGITAMDSVRLSRLLTSTES